jgi:actin-related protein 10
MYSNLSSTALAGRALSRRLRALLLNFATYTAPPPAIGSSSPAPQRVPEELLSDQVVEMVLTQGCFVGTAVANEGLQKSPSVLQGSSRTRRPSLGQGTSTENERVPYALGEAPELAVPADYDEAADEQFLAFLQRRYEKSSTATNTVFKVHPGFDSPPAMSFGSLLVPGWVRERAAEILFEESAGEDASLPELVLNALLKVSGSDSPD